METKQEHFAVAEVQKELASLIERHTRTDGFHSTAVPSLRLIRASRISEPIHSMYTPSLCLVVQGAKAATLADETYEYDPASYLVASVHLPIVGKISKASPEEPYLCAQMHFTADDLLEIVKHTDLAPDLKRDSRRGIFASKSNRLLVEAMLRLVKLLDAPEDIPVLAPLVIREILYRVMQDDQGDMIAQFAMIGSHAHRVAKAIRLIHRDYASPLRVEDLAKEVHMSPSSFHKHFKNVTAMSPLQYQKLIRLQEARRLMLTEAMEAADAAFRVGYESPSQFSREYARTFGRPPASDMKHLRNSSN